MSSKPFELRIEPEKSKDYALALYRMPVRGVRLNGSIAEPRLIARIRGTPMQAIIDQVLPAIKRSGYRPSDLSRGRRMPFQLDEEAGVRLGLMMLAVRPLRKASRMSDISERIQAMAEEEAYYWFSKSTDNGIGRRCQKAMRILLAKE